MQDTPENIKEKYRRMLLQKSGIDRMVMGVNMAKAARTMVLSSLSDTLSKDEQKEKIFLRFYSNDFSPRERVDIIKYLKGKKKKIRSTKSESNPNDQKTNY